MTDRPTGGGWWSPEGGAPTFEPGADYGYGTVEWQAINDRLLRASQEFVWMRRPTE